MQGGVFEPLRDVRCRKGSAMIPSVRGECKTKQVLMHGLIWSEVMNWKRKETVMLYVMRTPRSV